MFQNDGEMFDLEYGGGARYYNGHLEVASTVLSKKEGKIKKRKVMSKRDDGFKLSSLDGKHQFADKLKALLKTGTAVNENGIDADDPYTFSEPEPQVLRLHQTATPINTYSRRCIALSSKFGQIVAKKSAKNMLQSTCEKNSQLDNMGHDMKMQPLLVGHHITSQPQVIPFFADSGVVGDCKASDDESSKTMNRLQAKIARKKVIGKHKKATHVNSWDGELLQAKHSSFSRERSLLEEQLLGVKQEAVVKKEPKSPPVSSPKSSRHSARAAQHSPLMLVTIPPKRRCRVTCRQTAATRHEALQRIRQLQSSLQHHKYDLYPLGLEASESEDSDSEDTLIYQRHWFSTWDQAGMVVEGQRGAKLCSMKGELRRRLCQLSAAMAHRPEDKLARALVDVAQVRPGQAANFLYESRGRRYHIPGTTYNRSKLTMLRKRQCCYRQSEKDACTNTALPCTQHCMRHIMYNVNQLLYEHCTAKFSDNTQCCIPVFDICHELPLCLEHARKRDNYDKMCAETKPKRIRKKAKPSAMTRPSKRGKKKRKTQRPSDPPPPPSLNMSMHEEGSRIATSGFISDAEEGGPFSSTVPAVSMMSSDVATRDEIVTTSSHPAETSEHLIDKVDHHSNASLYSEINIKEEPYSEITIKEEQIDVNEVEGIAYPLDPELGHQTTNLLEEHDLTNVLNQIPADAFNDLFTEDKNGEYEPTREETEELERALEAVDKDVKSLEKLSQSQGLLDTLIDEQTLEQTLAQLPEVPSLSVSGGVVPVFTTYHNGFVLNSHDVTSSAQLKNFVQHPVDVAPTISIQTQTDMPS